MPFQSGISGNPAGRPKDATSKQNTIVRDAIHTILSTGAEKLQAEMNKLSGKDYVASYTALLEYTIPKKARVQHTSTNEDEEQQIFEIGDQIIYFN